jgi:hypothetical protein
MATTKVTFTLDRTSIQKLEDAADRLSVPKSEVVREAITEFHGRLGRLSDRERRAMLRTFDDVVPKIAPRSNAAVNRELTELREARKTGGRRTRPAQG